MGGRFTDDVLSRLMDIGDWAKDLSFPVGNSKAETSRPMTGPAIHALFSKSLCDPNPPKSPHAMISGQFSGTSVADAYEPPSFMTFHTWDRFGPSPMLPGTIEGLRCLIVSFAHLSSLGRFFVTVLNNPQLCDAGAKTGFHADYCGTTTLSYMLHGCKVCPTFYIPSFLHTPSLILLPGPLA